MRIAVRLRRRSTDAGGPKEERAGVVAIYSEIKSKRSTFARLRNRSSPGEQNGVRDRLCYSRAQTFASDVVGPEVLAGINSAQSRLLRSGREAGEVALRSGNDSEVTSKVN